MILLFNKTPLQVCYMLVNVQYLKCVVNKSFAVDNLTSFISSLACCSFSGLFAQSSLASASRFFCNVLWASCKRCHTFILCSKQHWGQQRTPKTTSHYLFSGLLLLVLRYAVVFSNPHGPQQSDVIGQELSEDEEIAEGLLLMQLLHLILHFRQLWQRTR